MNSEFSALLNLFSARAWPLRTQGRPRLLRLALLTLAATLCLAQPELPWGAPTANLRIGIQADPEHHTLLIAVQNNSSDQLDFAFDNPGAGQPARVVVRLIARGPDSKDIPLTLITPRNARTSVDAHDTLRWEFPLADLGYRNRGQWEALPALWKRGLAVYAVATFDRTERATSTFLKQ